MLIPNAYEKLSLMFIGSQARLFKVFLLILGIKQCYIFCLDQTTNREPISSEETEFDLSIRLQTVIDRFLIHSV